MHKMGIPLGTSKRMGVDMGRYPAAPATPPPQKPLTMILSLEKIPDLKYKTGTNKGVCFWPISGVIFCSSKRMGTLRVSPQTCRVSPESASRTVSHPSSDGSCSWLECLGVVSSVLLPAPVFSRPQAPASCGFSELAPSPLAVDSCLQS